MFGLRSPIVVLRAPCLRRVDPAAVAVVSASLLRDVLLVYPVGFVFAHFGILLLSRYFCIVSAFPALHRLHLHPYWYPV
jgi:hypothetical protein